MALFEIFCANFNYFWLVVSYAFGVFISFIEHMFLSNMCKENFAQTGTFTRLFINKKYKLNCSIQTLIFIGFLNISDFSIVF